MDSKTFIKWTIVKYTKKAKNWIISITSKDEEPYPIKHPLTLNEWYDSYHDNHRDNLKKVYLQRLVNLKHDIKRSVQLTNCRLSINQIMELEDIKSKLKLYA